MPLFQITAENVSQIKPNSFINERDLQKLFEVHLEPLMGVRLIATEFSTGDRQRGRIDSLGLDQDDSPVIFEYKKSINDNIINQGLFYLDWLVDHKGDFTLAAQNALGKDVTIDWSRPRLILIAASFSHYDKFAVNRIGANIELWTYQRYGENFLYLDAIYVTGFEKGKKSNYVRSPVKTSTLSGDVVQCAERSDAGRESIHQLVGMGIAERAFR